MAKAIDATTAPASDFIAVILIGGGSSWGRSPDKEEAIKNAIAALRDWEVYFAVSDIEITLNVVDVKGYSTCHWGGGYPGGWMRGTNETTGEDEAIKRPVEIVKRQTPKWPKPRKRR